MAKKSPTQRSLQYLRDAGYMVAITEHWNPFARIRQDLFGFVDLLAIKDSETVGVQTTSASNVAARIGKIQDSPALDVLRSAGWRIVVHGWRKNAAGIWILKEVDIS